VSSSSQLSSHRCVVPAPLPAVPSSSSFDQSVNHVSKAVYHDFKAIYKIVLSLVSCYVTMTEESAQRDATVPSTGKSSNSSSSSSCAAGALLPEPSSGREPSLVSETIVLVVF